MKIKRLPKEMTVNQHPPNYPLRYPKYHLIETMRPLREVRRGCRQDPLRNQ